MERRVFAPEFRRSAVMLAVESIMGVKGLPTRKSCVRCCEWSVNSPSFRVQGSTFSGSSIMKIAAFPPKAIGPK